MIMELVTLGCDLIAGDFNMWHSDLVVPEGWDSIWAEGGVDGFLFGPRLRPINMAVVPAYGPYSDHDFYKCFFELQD